MPTKPALALFLAAATLLGVSEAQAHAKLANATPAENAAVAAPQVITLKFTEKRGQGPTQPDRRPGPAAVAGRL